MAIPMTSGPAFIYIARQVPGTLAVKGSAATSIYFLGTCEQPPTLQLNPQWEPVMNDIGGSLLPIDYSYQGEDGLFSGTINKWNEATYLKLSGHGLNQGPTARGAELWADIGMLSQTETASGAGVYIAGANTFQLFVHFPYSAQKTVYGASGAGMPAGMRFPACRLAGHVIGPGTRANRRQLIVHCDRARNETIVNTTSGFILYDHQMSNIGAVPPITADGITV